MDLKIYKLRAKSNLYLQNYDIRAVSLQDACKKAKIKFAKSYHQFGDNVKIGIREDDIKNHIEEIFQNLIRKGN